MSIMQRLPWKALPAGARVRKVGSPIPYTVLDLADVEYPSLRVTLQAVTSPPAEVLTVTVNMHEYVTAELPSLDDAVAILRRVFPHAHILGELVLGVWSCPLHMSPAHLAEHMREFHHETGDGAAFESRSFDHHAALHRGAPALGELAHEHIPNRRAAH